MLPFRCSERLRLSRPVLSRPVSHIVKRGRDDRVRRPVLSPDRGLGPVPRCPQTAPRRCRTRAVVWGPCRPRRTGTSTPPTGKPTWCCATAAPRASAPSPLMTPSAWSASTSRSPTSRSTTASSRRTLACPPRTSTASRTTTLWTGWDSRPPSAASSSPPYATTGSAPAEHPPPPRPTRPRSPSSSRTPTRDAASPPRSWSTSPPWPASAASAASPPRCCPPTPR